MTKNTMRCQFQVPDARVQPNFLTIIVEIPEFDCPGVSRELTKNMLVEDFPLTLGHACKGVLIVRGGNLNNCV